MNRRRFLTFCGAAVVAPVIDLPMEFPGAEAIDNGRLRVEIVRMLVKAPPGEAPFLQLTRQICYGRVVSSPVFAVEPDTCV